MIYQMKRPVAVIFAIFFVAAAFIGAQTASADGGNDVAMEMIVLQVETQQVDTDGDGQTEPVSAYFVVNDRGTVTGVMYKNYNFTVKWDSASVEETADGQIAVEAKGTDVETGETYRMAFRFDPRQAGSGSNSGGGEIILIDLVGASISTVNGTVQYYRGYDDNETIAMVADVQEVDLDGDGRTEPVAAYFVVNDSGTVSGGLYKNFNFTVSWDSASVEETNDGQIAVEAKGTDVETGESYRMTFEFDPRQAGSGSNSGGGEIILVDIVGSSAVQISTTVQFYFN